MVDSHDVFHVIVVAFDVVVDVDAVSSLHAPYNVTVYTSETTAKVSWLPAYDGGHPQHYVLWYPTHFNNLYKFLMYSGTLFILNF